ncbi:4615_t:CDS:1 [Paraglomus brasilianum]|uniref:4615_t:CDS:1 n=1 Tax=Paraglomus brasilianum TaxID=144538 RepID=A0A9N9BRW6_9GLOM|nr:4615_t:CDS:1 [Paraglomus brasilianum]
MVLATIAICSYPACDLYRARGGLNNGTKKRAKSVDDLPKTGLSNSDVSDLQVEATSNKNRISSCIISGATRDNVKSWTKVIMTANEAHGVQNSRVGDSPLGCISERGDCISRYTQREFAVNGTGTLCSFVFTPSVRRLTRDTIAYKANSNRKRTQPLLTLGTIAEEPEVNLVEKDVISYNKVEKPNASKLLFTILEEDEDTGE